MLVDDHKCSRIVIIKDKRLNVQEGIDFVSSPKCGAINTFLGTIRDAEVDSSDPNNSSTIKGIHYEAYESMAMRQILEIINDTIAVDHETKVDSNCKVYVGIRLGEVPVGEASILICVSSTGRACSHKAVLMILEKIKSLATIWKKIIFADGTERWADIVKSEAFWLKRDK